MKILVVEDVDDTREMTAYLLELMLRARYPGVAVAQAEHGGRAWEMLQTDNYDLIVTDGDMPVMDGLELTKNIRAAPKTQNTKVIMMSARDENRSLAEAAGVNRFLLKPIHEDQLEEAINSLFGGPAPGFPDHNL